MSFYFFADGPGKMGGFYDPARGPVPEGAKEVDDDTHQRLLSGQNQEMTIVAGDDGFPILAPIEAPVDIPQEAS